VSLKGLFNARWPGVALFDLDGTLVDSAPDLSEAVDLTLQELGRPPAGLEKVRPWVGNGAKVLIRRALANKRDWEPASAQDDALIESALEIFFKHYRNTNGKHARVYPGVKECLAHLSACSCRISVPAAAAWEWSPTSHNSSWPRCWNRPGSRNGSSSPWAVTPSLRKSQTPPPCYTP